MGIEHEPSGKIIDIRPLGTKIDAARTSTLVKTPAFELLRLVIHKGREISQHAAPGDLIIQCLEGEIEFTSKGKLSVLHAGDLMYLPNGEPHSLKATYNSSLLVTILFIEADDEPPAEFLVPSTPHDPTPAY
ncbi:MAG: cupin domain-containing protein [Planctomycetaceae bacterium]|nr:cupin domain-containing protein [Planctomycetaceae bacterium]